MVWTTDIYYIGGLNDFAIYNYSGIYIYNGLVGEWYMYERKKIYTMLYSGLYTTSEQLLVYICHLTL